MSNEGTDSVPNVQLRKRSNSDPDERKDTNEKPAQADCKPRPALRELRLVLLGRTGSGKSATGNSILGEERFGAGLSMSSLTRECDRASAAVEGRQLTLIDTPDFSDTDQTLQKLHRCLALCSPGPHVFLLVVPIGRFTEEQQRAGDMILEMFHEDVPHHTILIFSHADKLGGESIEGFISRQNQKVQDLVERFGRRFVAFDNTHPPNPDQVRRLLRSADEVLARNHSRPFISPISEDAERILHEDRHADLAERKRRIRNDVRKLANVRRAALAASVDEERQDSENKRKRIRSRIDRIEADIQREEQNVRTIPARLQRFRAALGRERDTLRRLGEREEEDRTGREEEEKKDLELWRKEEEQRRLSEEGLSGERSEDPNKKCVFLLGLLAGFVLGLLAGFVPGLLDMLQQTSEDRAQNSWFGNLKW